MCITSVLQYTALIRNPWQQTFSLGSSFRAISEWPYSHPVWFSLAHQDAVFDVGILKLLITLNRISSDCDRVRHY